jgi:hypothetical protein
VSYVNIGGAQAGDTVSLEPVIPGGFKASMDRR